jgi:CheY-like chemotaxis protein
MSERSEEPVATSTHRPSVLIVDDQPAIRAVLTSILVGHGGFDVADAEDGIAALARIDECYTRDAGRVTKHGVRPTRARHLDAEAHRARRDRSDVVELRHTAARDGHQRTRR